MISNISSSTGVPTPAPASSQTAASGKTLVQTPIGGVMEDAQSTPDFYALFSPMTATPAAAAQPTSAAPDTVAPAAQPNATTPDTAAATDPTLAAEFGSQPFMANPGGTGPEGIVLNFNPVYFATQATAEKVASLVGGTVVAKDATITNVGVFQQADPNEMIQFANGSSVNAGLIANFFDHGYSQSYINTLLANVTNGEQA